MLSIEEKQEIEAQLTHHGDGRTAGLDALKIVQRHRGWVSDEAIADIAQLLGLAVAELEGIATFYNLVFRRPVGRHVILVCDSVSCWLMGCTALREQIAQQLGIESGGTTPDGRFTLLPTVCLGACDHAPVMMIGDDTHLDADTAKIEHLLDQYR
ncbi:MAG: NADH-quinone oxidoreductase subunit NuoE [Dokdonella sp.]